MKIAYLDCFSGISGDMMLGALLDAGLDLKKLDVELKKLNVPGFKIRSRKVVRNGISGTKFDVLTQEQHKHRNLKDICTLIQKSKLDDDIKTSAKKAFTDLATVEAAIHHKEINEIHFHEIGAIDSIVDIVGSFIGIKLLEIEAVYASRVHLGTGFVKCQHGTFPLPAPATLALLKNVPVYSQGIEAELVTPTGACLLKNLVKSFGPMPAMKMTATGYGAGYKELSIPNVLRISIGETQVSYEKDEVILIETNIDDMTPENIGYVQEMLFSNGAKDVFLTSIFMKKNRPGVKLSVLIDAEKLDRMLSIVFTETTSLGVRLQYMERRKLAHEIVSVKTALGHGNVKIGKRGNDIKTLSPEYESCREIAIKKKLPFKQVYHQVKDTAEKKWSDFSFKKQIQTKTRKSERQFNK